MKKIITLLALVVIGLRVNAQVDTLFVGDRDPVYYYWDTNWWDYYALNYPDYNNFWSTTLLPIYCKAEVARYCFTPKPLRVIGIAACLEFYFERSNYADLIPDTFFINRMVPEYFRLYEVDGNSDTMLLMAQGEWTPKTPQRHLVQTSMGSNFFYDGFKPIFEVFFDSSAITVYDSFYVAVTGNNNYQRSGFNRHTSPGVDSYVTADVVNTTYSDSDDKLKCPHPNHYKRKLHYFDAANTDDAHCITDTNWHTIASIYDPQYSHALHPEYLLYTGFLHIFPIIDTSEVVPPAVSCNKPEGLSLIYANYGVATLSWSGGDADYWQLSVCPDNCNPEDGDITTWTANIATVTNLDTAQWYNAWVRSVCVFDDSVCYSDWSYSLHFDFSNDVRIETVVDSYTHMMPNPASETVTVISSFRIGDVEVYTLDGRSVMKQQVDAISTTFDISTLAAGTYVVRIATNNGATTKKLVVK